MSEKGTCHDCGTKCDSRARRCAGCRWDEQRRRQGPWRFWEKVDPDGDCWLWAGHLMPKGYGQFRGTAGKTVMAHRMSWTLTYGSIPEDLCVLHACDEPRCVRPEHLFLGTKADNNRDMTAKGRHHAQKATPDVRSAMREARERGDLLREIGARFGFSESRVSSIVRSSS